MPSQYFFDSIEDDRVVVDDHGTICADVTAARDLAAVALAELAKDTLPGTERKVLQIDVRDSARLVLTTRLVFEASLAT